MLHAGHGADATPRLRCVTANLPLAALTTLSVVRVHASPVTGLQNRDSQVRVLARYAAVQASQPYFSM